MPFWISILFFWTLPYGWGACPLGASSLEPRRRNCMSGVSMVTSHPLPSYLLMMRIEIIPAHNCCNFPPWWGPHLQYELTSCWVNPKVITHKAGQLIFWAKNNWKRRLLGYHRFFLNEFIPFGWCFIKWLIFSTVYGSILLVKLKLNDFHSSLNWRWENDQNILKSQQRHPGHKDTSKCLQNKPF